MMLQHTLVAPAAHQQSQNEDGEEQGADAKQAMHHEEIEGS